MGSGTTESIPCGSEAEGSETTIEIKIKTLDSQTYTLKVDKEMPVPALKEQIASVTGVLSEQQRLICQGKVLKDDQLLSAYHVEDGHTLHLVVRQPVPPSSEGLPSRSESDPGLSSGRLHGSHVSPSSIVIETLSLPDQGEGVPPEISRIVSAVLGSFGFSSIGSSDGVEVVRNGQQRSSAASGTSDAVQTQSEQTGTGGQSQGSQSAFGLQTGLALGSLNPPVILDSVTTLSQYVSRMRQEFGAIGRDNENSSQSETIQSSEQNTGSSTSQSGSVQERLPTPAYLAEVMHSTRQLLTEQVAECLQNLATQLENQTNITDPVVRTRGQSTAWRTGVQLHNLGAMLLELGRTITTLRLGQTPTDAVVNAGPSVFINSSGPNPLMVQPLPFQQGTSFSPPNAGSLQPGSGLVSGVSTGFLPRRIDIQIRRASGNANREETSDNQQPSGQRNPGSGTENRGNQTSPGSTEVSVSREAGVRVVPIRTMLAAVPSAFSRSPSDSSANNLGVYYPVIGRFQNAVSGLSSGEQHQSSRQLTTESATQQQNREHNTINGSLPTSGRSREHSTTRTINVNILSAGGAQNNNESDGQIPSNVMNLLQTLFPGGEIHAEDVTVHGTASGSTPQSASTASVPEQTESRVTEEGVFLSNILREIVPLVSQHGNAESSIASAGEEATADHPKPPDSDEAENPDAGTSHRRDDSEQGLPNAKRQKRD